MKFECTFNSAKLYNDLEVLARFKKLSWNELADEIGVSRSTLSRLQDGRKPDADGLATIFHFTGFDFAQYIVRAEVVAEPTP